MSGVPQESVLGPFLFLMHENDIWRNLDSTIKLCAKECIIFVKSMNESDIHTADRMEKLGEWAVEIAMKINLGKSKAVSFMRGQMNEPLNYFFCDQKILEASSCKYLGIILCSNLNWVDKVNYSTNSLEGSSFHNACS